MIFQLPQTLLLQRFEQVILDRVEEVIKDVIFIWLFPLDKGNL